MVKRHNTNNFTGTISETGPMIAVGSAKAQGSRVKPTDRVRATQSNQSEGRSDTKDGQQLVHLLKLHF
jgi:hypothetical protein